VTSCNSQKYETGSDCRRHVGNSSACYKMGNYHPILMKVGKQTKKSMLSSKITKAQVQANFQDGRRKHC
jgi:hypothetical protein